MKTLFPNLNLKMIYCTINTKSLRNEEFFPRNQSPFPFSPRICILRLRLSSFAARSDPVRFHDLMTFDTGLDLLGPQQVFRTG